MNRAAFAAAVAAARGTGRVAARVTTRTAAVPRANVGGQGATRRMGTSTHQAGSGGGRRPYGGFEPHMPTDVYVKSSLYLQALMWFWVFYRFKEDGAVLLGLRHPWDGHGGSHGHGDDHGDGHGHTYEAPSGYAREHPGGPIIAAGSEGADADEDDE